MSTLSVTNITGQPSGNFGVVNAISVADQIGNIREVPIAAKTISYTLVANDCGKIISTNSAVIIPASIFSNGQNISIYNNSSASITISSATGVNTYLVGTASTGSRTLSQNGLVTIICMSAANTFVISGGGLS